MKGYLKWPLGTREAEPTSSLGMSTGTPLELMINSPSTPIPWAVRDRIFRYFGAGAKLVKASKAEVLRGEGDSEAVSTRVSGIAVDIPIKSHKKRNMIILEPKL